MAQLQLRTLGLSDADMELLEEKADEKEKQAMEFAMLATTAAYKIDDQLMGRVKKLFDDAQLVELMAVVGLFNYINRFNDALGILPDQE